MKTVHVLPFGQLLKHMLSIRGKNDSEFAARLNLPEQVFPVLYSGTLYPNQELEQKLRELLDWPKGTDDLLSIVISSKWGDEVGLPKAETKPEPMPEPVTSKITPAQAETLKRSVGRPRSTRAFDEERPINLNNLHGRVLG